MSTNSRIVYIHTMKYYIVTTWIFLIDYKLKRTDTREQWTIASQSYAPWEKKTIYILNRLCCPKQTAAKINWVPRKTQIK